MQHTALLAVVVCALCWISTAVTCNCFNGRQVGRTCECSCDSGYLGPTCTFGVTDTVEVVFSLNMSTSNFVSETFVNATSFAASAPCSFVSAKNVSRFFATMCTVSLPGYAVSRLMTSVAYKDPWTEEYSVMSAAVVTPSTTVASSSIFNIDYTFYQQGNITVTLSGVLYLAAAAVLVVLLVGVETSLSTNVEENRMLSSKLDRSSSGRGGKKREKVPSTRKNNYMADAS